MPPFFSQKHNCNKNEIYMDDSYVICNYEAIFLLSVHFQHTFTNVEENTVYKCYQVLCFNFGAHHERYRETSNVKDVLLLHGNAWPHTSFRRREAIGKMGWALLPHPAHSPDLAASNYHLFGPVKDALCGCHFADDIELIGSFRDVLQSQGTSFLFFFRAKPADVLQR
jgi:hypothetical protein